MYVIASRKSPFDAMSIPTTSVMSCILVMESEAMRQEQCGRPPASQGWSLNATEEDSRRTCLGMHHLAKRVCNLRVLRVLIGFLCLACLYTVPCLASELKQETIAAFDEYVKATQARMAEELNPAGAFLYPDGLPGRERNAVYEQLRHDEVFVTRLETMTQGKLCSAKTRSIENLGPL